MNPGHSLVSFWRGQKIGQLFVPNANDQPILLQLRTIVHLLHKIRDKGNQPKEQRTRASGPDESFEKIRKNEKKELLNLALTICEKFKKQRIFLFQGMIFNLNKFWGHDGGCHSRSSNWSNSIDKNVALCSFLGQCETESNKPKFCCGVVCLSKRSVNTCKITILSF